MDFNPNPKKQAIEVCFSLKIVINNPSPLSLNQSQVELSESHKHLGLIPDTKLKFHEHLADKKTSAIELLGPYIQRLSLILPRTCHLTIYKVFVKTHLDKSKLQSYLLLQALNQYSTRSAKKNFLTAVPSRTFLFSNTFFPYCINEWNKLSGNLGNANYISKFKN